jgi:FkbM family methyltransferase
VKKDLARFGISTYSFVDNDKAKVGQYINGTPVVSPEALFADKQKYILIGTVTFHNEIVSQLLSGGVRREEIFFIDFLHMDETISDYFLNNIDAALRIFDKCADDESRQLFVGNMLYQFSRDRAEYRMWNFRLSPLEQQYYEPSIIILSGNDVYMDCGAKDGDTAVAFHNYAGGNYRKIITFEPDKVNFEALLRNTDAYPDIENVNVGVGECDAILAFDGGHAGHSAFSEKGGMQVRIVPLDSYFDEKPTLIKMDIEGFELSALRGTQRIITELKPQMAICVYHKPRDIVELPDYVLSLRDDYQIYYRQYREFGHDLVCYFV